MQSFQRLDRVARRVKFQICILFVMGNAFHFKLDPRSRLFKVIFDLFRQTPRHFFGNPAWRLRQQFFRRVFQSLNFR